MEPNQFDVSTYFSDLKQVLDALRTEDVYAAIEVISTVWKQGKQIIALGNGGSALTALHYITDWNKSVYLATGLPFRGRTLMDNMGLLTAYANDISYEDCFVEQLKNILQPGDLVIAISGSGNSENVIRAVDYANANQGVTLGICGYSGGKLLQKAQHALLAAVDDMQISEDVHLIFGHLVMRALAC